MLKRCALMFAATAVLAIPATSAFAAPHKTTGVLPEQACFALMPAASQPALCGQGPGGPGGAQ